jgi:hypothetical protein
MRCEVKREACDSRVGAMDAFIRAYAPSSQPFLEKWMAMLSAAVTEAMEADSTAHSPPEQAEPVKRIAGAPLISVSESEAYANRGQR